MFALLQTVWNVRLIRSTAKRAQCFRKGKISHFHYKIHNIPKIHSTILADSVFLWGEMLTRIFEKIGLSSHRVWWSDILGTWWTAAFIFCPFINPVYSATVFHPSIHPSVHRAFLTRVHPSVMTSSDLALVHRQLKEMSLVLVILLKENSFFFLVKPSSFLVAR